jgi:hypothetical protein
MICSPQQILRELTNQKERDGRETMHVWETREVHTGFS